MGEVYLADDTHFGRQVAIKLIKQGFGTKEFVRHFRQEERILAALNHPNIARLYGGAVTQEAFLISSWNTSREFRSKPTPPSIR